jgi:ElaB/YqjD/DUF883 family membrane-anchored ribosome-binding protein
MSKKLQNIKAIQQMIDGTHKFQTRKTVGFSDADATAKKNEKHEPGDTWEETDPVTGVTYVIEQREGFRIKKTKNSDVFQSIRDEMRSFPNCPKETCTCLTQKTYNSPANEKMRKIHGMCLDCVVDMEHELKKSGKYAEYEQNKIRENALAWLESAERDVELLKRTYTEASKFVTNADGLTEEWSAKMTPEEFDETIQKQFDKFKENFLKNLNGEENDNI